MVRLAGPLGCDPRDLLLAPTLATSKKTSDDTAQTNTLPILQTSPLKSKKAPDAFSLGKEIDRTEKPSFLTHTQDAYAIYVTGDSMSPMFRERQLLLINPHKPPTYESGVLIITKNGEHIIRAFIKRVTNTIHLRSFHPEEQTTTFKESEIKEIHTIVATIDT